VAPAGGILWWGLAPLLLSKPTLPLILLCQLLMPMAVALQARASIRIAIFGRGSNSKKFLILFIKIAYA
jgi:hypothetical protein